MAEERLRYIIETIFRGGSATAQASREIKAVGGSAKQAEAGMKGASKAATGFKNAVKTLAGIGVLYGAGRAMVGFAKDSLRVASSVEETASLIRTSLGPAADDFQADMGRIADATNRSRFELEEGASTIIAMSRSMGMAQAEAGEFAASLTQAGVDLGSFFNRETSEVFRDIQAALGGSSETMQKYGIDVRETTLKQMALEKGLTITGGTLDRVQRAWLIQESIMEQASDAMGDAERTSDSYENTMRGLEAATMDLKVALGTALIPVVKDVVTVLDAAANQLGVTARAMSGDMGKEVEKQIDRNIEAATTTQDYIEQAERIAHVAGIWGGLGPVITGTQDEIQAGLEDSVRGLAQTADSYEEYIEILNNLPFRVGNAAFHMDGLTEEFYKHQRGVLAGRDADRKFFNQQQDVNASVEEGAQILATYTERQEDRANMTAMEEALLLDVGDATRVYNDLTEDATEKTDSYWQAVEKSSQRLREAEEAQRQANVAIGQDFVKALDGANMELDDFERLMVESAAAAGAQPELLFAAAIATGDYGDEAAEAAIKQAAMIAKAEELGGALAEGRIDVEDAITALQDFQEELDRDYTLAFDHSAVSEAERRVDSIEEKMRRLDGMQANISVNVSGGNVPLPREQPGFQHGGSFTVGGRGGPDSQLVAFMATPGERVDVTPSNLANGGGGFQMNGNIIIQLEGPVTNPAAFAKQAAPALMNEMNSQMRGG